MSTQQTPGFEPLSAEQWAARISAETKGKASLESLTRPSEDGTVLRPYYVAGAERPQPLARTPGWRTLEELPDSVEDSHMEGWLARARADGVEGVLLPAERAAVATPLTDRPALIMRAARGGSNETGSSRADDVRLVELPLEAIGQWAASLGAEPGAAALIDLRPLHEAGAPAAWQLAVWQAALEVLPAPSPRWVQLGVGSSLPVEIAKLRAARALALRHSSASAFALHATTSGWHQSRLEPYTNVIRGTVQAFAAVAGGADALSVRPHSVGDISPEGEHLARRIALLLRHESYLDTVADPGAGSYALEAITAQLIAEAQALYEKLSQQGGLSAAVASSWLSEQVKAAAAQRSEAVKRGERKFVGANAFRAGDAPAAATSAEAFDPSAAGLRAWRGPAVAE